MRYSNKPHIQEQGPEVVMERGNMMHFYVDTSQPSDSVLHRWTEVIYDGSADAVPLDVPKHWHDYHDEHMEILEGRLNIYVGDDIDIRGRGWRVVTPADGMLFIPRGVVHAMKSFDGEKTILKEYTSPTGRFKEAFFRDLYQEGPPGLPMGVRAFYEGDTWPYVGGGSIGRWFSWSLVMVLGSIAKLFKPKRPLDVPYPKIVLKTD